MLTVIKRVKTAEGGFIQVDALSVCCCWPLTEPQSFASWPSRLARLLPVLHYPSLKSLLLCGPCRADASGSAHGRGHCGMHRHEAAAIRHLGTRSVLILVCVLATAIWLGCRGLRVPSPISCGCHLHPMLTPSVRCRLPSHLVFRAPTVWWPTRWRATASPRASSCPDPPLRTSICQPNQS